MRIIEILLPTSSRRGQPNNIEKQVDLIQKRMDSYVDKILSPNTSSSGKEFLKSRLRDEYQELKNLFPRINKIAEAVHKLPLSENDFKLLKELFERPIPAIVAPIYISEIINDDELNDELRILGESDPGRDIRHLISEWITRVMPDQLFRFTDELVPTYTQQNGNVSPIHGYTPPTKAGEHTKTGSSGNAYGRY